MLYGDKERAWIKYYYALLEMSMEQIKKLEQRGENSQELDEWYSNMFTWSERLSGKVKELWDIEEADDVPDIRVGKLLLIKTLLLNERKRVKCSK